MYPLKLKFYGLSVCIIEHQIPLACKTFVRYTPSIVSVEPNFFASFILGHNQQFHCSCRQELQQAREKRKEEEVIALKRSMESGMVSFY